MDLSNRSPYKKIIENILRLLGIDDEPYRIWFGSEALSESRKDVKWLNSLKDRTHPQCEHKWSDDDERWLLIL